MYNNLIPSLLIVLGLVCLATAGSFFIESNSNMFLETLLKLCLLIGIPIIILGLIYFIIRLKGKNK